MIMNSSWIAMGEDIALLSGRRGGRGMRTSGRFATFSFANRAGNDGGLPRCPLVVRGSGTR